MYKLKISNRYGSLHEVTVNLLDMHGEKEIFPTTRIPLVFKTYFSAHKIGCEILEHISNRDLANCHNLLINNVVIATLPLSIIKNIVEVWKKQSIIFKSISISECKLTMKNKSNKNDIDKILEEIYLKGNT